MTSTMTAPCCFQRPAMSVATTSTPGDVQPRRRGRRRRPARRPRGWTSSVTSVAVPPVLRLALRRMSTAPARRRDRVGREALLGQHGQGDGVELDHAQRRWRGRRCAAGRGSMAIDQLGDGRARRRRPPGARLAACRGDQPVADDQQAEVGPGDESLDDDARLRPVRGPRRAPLDLLAGLCRLVATPRPWLPSRA